MVKRYKAIKQPLKVQIRRLLCVLSKCYLQQNAAMLVSTMSNKSTQHPLFEELLLELFTHSNILNVVLLYTLLYKALLGCNHPKPRLP